ncbi:MAG: homoserine dehydrogenase [SAR86 cluster bacterium]|uniref:Homoserine dehydrogenase n=1 Tax=SAR86 cluster bacterium TaxID=2030880 RepID=A0A2A5CD76_9GAMM|nr:MAG: homoserine dehydrogenase [SAR86 cluster bacterium]
MQPINIGICGLGTVGYGSYGVLKSNQEEISRRLGKLLCVSHIATLSLKDGQDIGDVKITDDAMVVARDPEVNILLELIGGTEFAYQLVLEAIAHGKHVVTANKALIATYGNEIFKAARDNNVIVAYEAAVAGGIPIIKVVREGLAANKIDWLAGIINGTGNYILTEMQSRSRPFVDVLKEAQDLGYAEADPTYDVEGIDAAHKLTILSALAFGTPLQLEKVYTEGISQITPEDLEYADELGYRIKHLGISSLSEQGIDLRVHPTLIAKQELIAKVDGVMNAVLVHGDAVGSTLYYGAGAGAEPTASAVVADVIDIVRRMGCIDNSKEGQEQIPALAFQHEALRDTRILPIEEIVCAYYLRISVQDKVGVIADITEILGDNGISIDAMIQKDPDKSGKDHEAIPVIIMTHEIQEAVMNKAITELEGLDAVTAGIIRIRVAELG